MLVFRRDILTFSAHDRRQELIETNLPLKLLCDGSQKMNQEQDHSRLPSSQEKESNRAAFSNLSFIVSQQFHLLLERVPQNT